MTGYQSKKTAARDKLEDDDTQVYQNHDDTLTIAYQSGFYDGKKAAQPAQKPVAKPYRVEKRFTISLMEKLIEAKLKKMKRR